MVERPFEKLDEPAIRQLIADEAEESIRLEFKRQIDLGNRKDKAEAAKDASAFANTIGGRILYGIDESRLPDGTCVAGGIVPLTDPTIERRLEDVLVASITPRPRFRMKRVDVAGGFVLVVEAFPSYGRDLYMVSGFSESRFYRRSEKRTILMTEPEVREGYVQVAVARMSLDSALEKLVQSELAAAEDVDFSMIVAPFFGHRDLVNPRLFGAHLYYTLINEIVNDLHPSRFLPEELRIVATGYRGVSRIGGTGELLAYSSIQRSGLVHLSTGVTSPSGKTPVCEVYVEKILETVVAALRISRYVLTKGNYFGPVRLIYRLRCRSACRMRFPTDGHIDEMTRPLTDAGVHEGQISEFHFSELGTSLGSILSELLDQFYQLAGRPDCPWFSPSGDLKPAVGRQVNPVIVNELTQPAK